jgi:hypothetical protein
MADPETWILSIPKMLSQAGIDNVKYKTAYCCTPDRKVICELEGPDIDGVKTALTKIGIPFTEVNEVEVLKPFPDPYSHDILW